MEPPGGRAHQKPPQAKLCEPRQTRPPRHSGDAAPCRMTGVTLHSPPESSSSAEFGNLGRHRLDQLRIPRGALGVEHLDVQPGVAFGVSGFGLRIQGLRV